MKILVAFFWVFLLTACGGGGGSTPSASSQSSASSLVVTPVNRAPSEFKLQATKIGSTFVDVDWSSVSDADGDALDFSVSVDGKIFIKSTKDKKAVIDNLKMNTMYSIDVAATDSVGATTTSNFYIHTRADGDEISLHEIQMQQYTRQYSIFSPNNPEHKKLPLVIWFHGAGGKLSQQLITGGWPDMGSVEKFYVAMPQAINDEFESFTYWNADMGAKKDDGLLVEKIMDELVNNGDVDPDRIYVAGMSSGGFMTYYTAYRFQDRVAALAPIAAAIANQSFYANPSSTGLFHHYKINKPMPQCHIHGTADATVSINGGPGYASWSEVLNLWKVSNLITQLPTFTELPDLNKDDGSTVTLIQYRGPTKASDIDDYRVNNGVHAVPGEEYYANQDILSYKVIWDFFKGRRLSDRQ